MERNMDKIVFESRAEIGDVIRALETYMKEHPKERNFKTVERLYNLLDVMEMEW